jgi:hypothetical protein
MLERNARSPPPRLAANAATGGAASSPCSVAGVKIVLLATQAKSFRLWSTPEFVAWPGGGPDGAAVRCWPAPPDRDLVGGLRSVCNA